MSRRFQAGIVGVGFDPLKAPNPPTNVTATAANASASVSFTAPTNVGGSAITGYTVRSNPGGSSGTGSTSPITVSGLTNGTAYTFSVFALNSYGPSAAGVSNSVTPANLNYMSSLTASFNLYNTGSDIDSIGNLYAVGYGEDPAASDPLVFEKMNSNGAIQLQYTYTISATDIREPNCAVDGSGNIYIAAIGGSAGYLIKLDSTGAVQWAYQMSVSSGASPSIARTVYISGTTLYAGFYTGIGALLVSVNIASATPSVNWARRFLTGSGSAIGGIGGVVIAPSGALYVSGWYGTGGATTYGFIANLDTAGNVAWLRGFGGGRDIVPAIATDAASNLYVAGTYQTFPNKAYVYIFNSSYGAVGSIESGTSYPNASALTVDSSGNIYFTGANGYFAKWNSSLSLQFQRLITGSSQELSYGATKILGGRLYSSFTNRNLGGGVVYNFFGVKVPEDGTATGTYSVGGRNYTYASTSSITWTSGSGISTFSGAISVSDTVTLSAVTVTRATPSYTAAVATF